MNRKLYDSKEATALLNKIKEASQITGKPMTKKFLTDSLKACGMPNHSKFWKIFVNSGAITQISKGLYNWSRVKPLYWELLEQIKQDYKNLRKQDSMKPKHQVTIEEAISLLKENGYKIMKPTYVEV